MVLTENEQGRLAYLRSQNIQWLAVEPRSMDWDVSFLLRVIDKMTEDNK